ncbi:flagellar biosynthesis anti-sigma factor FlgM [Candidatus Sodalis endolongispinus]|uniref:Flagellar biosynthesis anti-sigma factor FlgM n=1 Tax=Candidatus Sodalis endolongispinus TaxID=2812662 RepID=A0ABS5YC89_9GAMM|nr:flagellar biosynthesis anti-sigma factor FlgM [Candidatus Sodalis endolongispinus]MBT9432639.1 flagellar biosynthesis anti-sigma factor FlgM [Candidatus Sodalis endolongispinus]
MSIEHTLPAHAIMAVVNDLRHGQSELPRRQAVPHRDRGAQAVTPSDRIPLRNQDVDQTRVTQLRQAVNHGKLAMDSGRVADALLLNAWQG